MTVTEFQQLVRARLREANNSKLGELQTGTGGSPTVSADDRIIELGKRASEMICKSCHFLSTIGTIESLPSGINRFALADLTFSAWGEVWRPITVAWNAYDLRETEPGNVRRDTRFGQPGTPTKWWREGESHIGLDPMTDRAAPLAVQGAGIPTLQNGAGSDPDYWDYLPDDALALMQVPLACYLLSLAYMDDESIVARGVAWKAEADIERQRRWEMLDETLRRKIFPSPITAMRGSKR